MWNFDYAWRVLASRLFGAGKNKSLPIDVNTECRREDVLTCATFFNWFVSDPVAHRVVSAYPDATWAIPPKIESRGDAEESAFDKAIIELDDRLALFSTLHNADIVSGIGEFGLIVLVFENGGDFSQPLAGSPKLAAIRVYSQQEVHIQEWDTNENSVRYGLPVRYQVGPKQAPASQAGPVVAPGSVGESIPTKPQTIHWTRCVHVVDLIVTNQVCGIPRLLPVNAPIQDIRKILGGSAQAIWNQGFPSFSFEIDTDKADIDLEDEETAKKLKERFQKFVEAAERMLAVAGGEIKSHQQQAQPPKEHFEVQLMAVAIATKIPLRLLSGSDDGKLAGDQNKGQFRTNVVARQNKYGTHRIVRPVVDILIGCGAIPKPANGYDVNWGDLDNMTEIERADVATKFTDALAKYSVGNVEAVFTFEEYLVWVWDFAPEVAKKLVQKATDQERLTHDPNDPQTDGQQPAGSVPQDGQPVETSGLAHKNAGANPEAGRT